MEKTIPTCFMKIVQRYRPNIITEKDISMENYLRYLHIIVFGFSSDSSKSMVEKTEKMFHALIKNYKKINEQQILFKCFTYFIDKGFDLFIQTLKSAKVIKGEEFHKLLLEVLDSAKIAKFFNMVNKSEIDNICHFDCFKKAVMKMNLTYGKKLGLFLIFFFRESVEAKDMAILKEVKKFLKKEKINNFCKSFSEEIDPHLAETKVNGTIKNEDYSAKEEDKPRQNEITIFSGVNEDKQKMEDSSNKIKEEDNNNYDIKDGSDSSKNDKTLENKENTSKQKGKSVKEDINNLDDKDSILISLKKEIDELKLKSSTSEKEICDLKLKTEKEMCDLKLKNNTYEKEMCDLKLKTEKEICDLKNQVNDLKSNIKAIKETLDLSLLINGVVAQRDSYKQSLEEIIKYLSGNYNLNLVIIPSTEIWRQTKEVCLKIIDSKEIEPELKEKIVNGLTSLLFCKDYINCLIHRKGKFSDNVKNFDDGTQKIMIPVASYSNMKEMTPKFFGYIANKKDEFGIINSILSEKMKKWVTIKEFDYSKYLQKIPATKMA